MTDWVLLGGDPTPGDPGLILNAATTFDAVATQAQDAGTAVTRLIYSVEHEGIWTGQAAREWVGQARALPPDLAKLHASYAEAATALRAYSADLDGYQQISRRAAADAIEADTALTKARRDIESAQASLNSAESDARTARSNHEAALRAARSPNLDSEAALQASAQASDSEGAVSDATQRVDQARAELVAAQGAESRALEELDDARRRADGARAAASEAAARLQRALATASEHGIQNREWYEKAYDNMIGSFQYAFTLENIIASLDMVSDIMGTMAFVAAFIPGGQVFAVALGAASLIFSVVALLGHAYRASQGDEGWGDVGLRAVVTAISVLGAARGLKPFLPALKSGGPTVGEMMRVGSTASAPTRPAHLRTTTEEFLGDVKRFIGGTDARGVGGFLNKQVSASSGSRFQAGIGVVKTTVEVHDGVSGVADTSGKVLDLSRGRLEMEPPPDLSDVFKKGALFAANVAKGG